MKAKDLVRLVGISAALTGALLFTGCEKDLATLDTPLPTAPEAMPELPGEIEGLLTPEEKIEFQRSFVNAKCIYSGDHIVLPVMIHLDVTLSQAFSSVQEEFETRNNVPGQGVDLAIFGEGSWTKQGRVRYFEVQYKPDQAGFWKGEGWLRRSLFGTNDDPALFFTSEKWTDSTPQRGSDFCLKALIQFSGGTCEYQWAFGEGVRKVFLSGGDMTKGEAVIYGYVVLSGTQGYYEEVCP
ncbi:MAG: hypothetical protein H6563_02050 [Lewinellaceae bacterium]|nr:hypothetical protein [Lewinellaceae bacterium]